MHTATQLDASMFSIAIDGREGTREEVFPGWHAWDRLGVIVHEPLGALGASMMIQLAITCFYDERPDRRDGLPQYPDIYAIHVGERHGDFSPFDFWPARKEVFVAGDPWVVLGTVHNLGITRLLVPDGPALPVEHEWKEAECAYARIAGAFAYGADGRLEEPDLVITGTDPRTGINTKRTLDPVGTLRMAADGRAGGAPQRGSRWTATVASRIGEVTAEMRASIAADRLALQQGGRTTESYRRLTVETALGRLVPATGVHS